jgi:dTDP-4-dehydrorhamnose reductase
MKMVGIVTNADECPWFEFAREVFDLAGETVKLEPIKAGESQRRARRRSSSALASARLRDAGLRPLHPWKEALEDDLRPKGVISGGGRHK